MRSELAIFAARLREQIALWTDDFSLGAALEDPAYRTHADIEFSGLAVMLFTLQFKHNLVYQRWCEARGIQPGDVHHWTEIPPLPAAAFKEFAVTALHPEDRLRAFHSSGTTAHQPSRHFHNVESLALYEASLWSWWEENLRQPITDGRLISLTPAADQVPHSSLVHMFEVVRRRLGGPGDVFFGNVAADGAWTVDIAGVVRALTLPIVKPVLLVGTAFSFVHLGDALAAQNLRLQLPVGSRVLETGGYKGRSRALPRAELHELIADRLGVAAHQIWCEYGMSELSSQAYAPGAEESKRCFRFPPWARARVVSPEHGREVSEGETGLLQVFDLANAFSVLALQTEDLAVRRGAGFDLLGRAPGAGARGCSLQSR